VYLSTNKVYGDAPNRIAMRSLRRAGLRRPGLRGGIPETFPIDQSTHSLFGASKVAADVMVQEYGRYFGMPTCALRGGCLTGPNHSGVELHGFLSYLVKCNLEGREYRIFGYKGKQVRDNIHSLDVARFVAAFVAAPKPGPSLQPGGRQGEQHVDPRGLHAGRVPLGQAQCIPTSRRTGSATISATTRLEENAVSIFQSWTLRSRWRKPSARLSSPGRGDRRVERSRTNP